jgi:hypothetical protein
MNLLSPQVIIERLFRRSVAILLIILLCLCFGSILSHAQAVPPRVQALQMIRPVAPPPEPPIQKQIRAVRDEAKSDFKKSEQRARLLDQKIEYFLGGKPIDPDLGAKPIKKKQNRTGNIGSPSSDFRK